MKLANLSSAIALLVFLGLWLPTQAHDEFDEPPTASPSQGQNTGNHSDSQKSKRAESDSAPSLRGAINGSVGPQSGNTIENQPDISSASRFEGIADNEVFVGILAKGIEILCFVFGAPSLIIGLMRLRSGVNNSLGLIALGGFAVLCGFAAPHLGQVLTAEQPFFEQRN